ncbi:hypothetical protein [Microbispora sp. GKU 823]|uniref:hypothetical protein n=1 Tax=Microbispora sp. GKU 823 TaxID=1652100 RepID=UPI0009A2B7A6|nr:hypothetical protein [Microbispora sp. GKU 823]OPG04124.1 hypothetical protein B1L11_38495 [Microbispora sp. GKU 823]
MRDDVQHMRELLGDLDRQQRDVTDAYIDGFRDGWGVGYGHRVHEENAAWQAARVQRGPDLQGVAFEHRALDRTYAAGVPCGRTNCGCSRCIRAEAVTRRGGDYQGGSVEWEPQQRSREVA